MDCAQEILMKKQVNYIWKIFRKNGMSWRRVTFFSHSLFFLSFCFVLCLFVFCCCFVVFVVLLFLLLLFCLFVFFLLYFVFLVHHFVCFSEFSYFAPFIKISVLCNVLCFYHFAVVWFHFNEKLFGYLKKKWNWEKELQ